jgi:inner membrane protein
MPPIKYSISLKVATLVLLMLLLSIPLLRIGWLVDERGASRQQAVSDLAAAHAGPQTVVGPVLVVPYVERWSESQLDGEGRLKSRVERSKESRLLVYPEKLELNGALNPQERQRGIFKVLFYALDGHWSGRFPPVDAARITRSEKDSAIQLLPPVIAFGLSDVRGVQGSPVLSSGGQALKFLPGVPQMGEASYLAQGTHAPVVGTALQAYMAGQPLPFDLKMVIIGQEKLSIAPVADDTQARLAINWQHLSFGGRFLAAQRTPLATGYEARWAVASLVSAAGKQVTASMNAARGAAVGPLDTFDVSLIQPQNPYSMADRAVKYGSLFVGLVLMAAFMFELFRKLRLHPVQYGLVGLSIALFFLLLLALSEKLAFGLAYGLASGASVLLLLVYFSAVLGGWLRGLSLAGFVGVLYGVLYSLLVSEDNALLMGSLLVFGMLAALMLVTRKVNWYALTPTSAPAVEA